MRIAIVFVGTLEDGGFNQCALDGALRAQASDRAEIKIVSGIPYKTNEMAQALDGAAANSDGVVFIGGQGNAVMPLAAAAHPDRAFAVVQGNVTGPNLVSYDILQEQSAFLAGVLAARVTRTGTIGHLSGHRVVPGLKGRAAFAAGIAHANAGVRLITGFCGTQDDSDITESWARGIAQEGADVIFTMLNAARKGATQACRATGMRQIGNAADWCLISPETFIASAIARIDLGVELAVIDMLAGKRSSEIIRMGLDQEAVSLTFAPDVVSAVRGEIFDLAAEIVEEKIFIKTTYEGNEFEAQL